MKIYEIKKFTSWDNIPVADINIPYLDTPGDITAKGQLAYSDDALLVHLVTYESTTRAEEEGTLGSPWLDSCLEFFFRPIEDDIRYFNIEFNSLGTQFFGFGENVEELTRLIVDKERIFDYKINKFDGGWEIFYKIPYNYIKIFFPDFKVYCGKVMYANFYKCADCSEPPHYLSWNEVERCEDFTFHRPDMFGKMIFVSE